MAKVNKPPLTDRMDPASGSFAMEDWPFYWLARVNRLYSNDLDMLLKKIDLDVARWRVLMMLYQEEVCSVSRLAEHAALRLSTMTKTVQRLQRDGMVNTRSGKEDARVTEVLLTDKGKAALPRVRQIAAKVYQGAFEEFDESQIDQLNTMIKRICRNLEISF